MNYRVIPFFLFGLFAFKSNPSMVSKTFVPTSVISSGEKNDNAKFEDIYENLKTNSFMLPSKTSFSKALEGFYKLKEEGLIEKNILTLIDFSLSSQKKRLWVIDLNSSTILFQSLVAHGKYSGNEYATQFSNKPQSYESSLGFYATGETYFGKHGYSLKLDGLEKGINNNARERAIVIHGADYVSENFIKKYGRLGRSFGCPSLPKQLSKEIIDTIKNKSCLYIYYSSKLKQ